MRFMLPVALLVCLAEPALATPQVHDTVVFGGRRYSILEVPMLGLWDYSGEGVAPGKTAPPEFEVRSSANWTGYRAVFEIRDSKLFLKRITGRIDGAKRKNEEIIPGDTFPILADWYTGRIHLEVGDFDADTQEATAVIIFHIEKGIVTRMEFAERMPLVWTWNGLPAEADPTPEPSGESRPAAKPNDDR